MGKEKMATRRQGASFHFHLPPKQGYRGVGSGNLEPQEGRERCSSTWNTPSLKFMHSCSCTFIHLISKRSLQNIGFLFHLPQPSIFLLLTHITLFFCYPNKSQSPFWNNKGLNHIYSHNFFIMLSSTQINPNVPQTTKNAHK